MRGLFSTGLFSTGLFAMAAAVVVTGCATAQPAPPSLVADPPLTDDGRAPGAGQADLDRGIAYIEKEAWDKALPYLDAALEAKPDNAEAHYYRALAQARLGNAEAAETGFEKAIELNPELTLARAHLGELYLTSQPPRAQKAIEVLTPAVEAEPKAADLHQLLGFAYRMEKNYKEASKHYQASLAAEDNADVRFDFADMLFEAGELDEAAAQMRLVLPKFKTDKAIVAQLAHRFAKAKAYDDCVEAFTVAIGLDQKEPGFFLHRGLCQHSLQKEEKARVDYKKAIDLDAKFQPGWYYMGMSWLGDNKRTQALDAFEKAWRIDKESAIGKAAKEKLDEVRKSR